MSLFRLAEALLQRPVSVRGSELGRPVDVIFDRGLRHAFGFEVLSPGDVPRFLPWIACELTEGGRTIELASTPALLTRDELGFYQARGIALSAIRGLPVVRDEEEVGSIADVVVDSNGAVRRILLDGKAGPPWISPGDLDLEVDDVGLRRATLGHSHACLPAAG